MKKPHNPWTRIGYEGTRTEVRKLSERLRLVDKFDILKLRDVLAWHDTQALVKEACRRRIRKLELQQLNNVVLRPRFSLATHGAGLL